MIVDIAPLLARAKALHPDIRVDDREFETWLRQRVEPTASLHWADLLVAHGCSKGDPAAVAAFDRELVSVAAHAAKRVGGDDPDELVQSIRVRMLVGDHDGPRLASYRGTGPLHCWLRVCVMREVLTAQRRCRPSESLPDDGPLMADIVGADPELELMKRDAADAFRRAFIEALAELPDRDKNVLRYHVLDGLTGEEVARIYGVSGASISRWLAKARERLLTSTRDRLQRALVLDGEGIETLMWLIASRLDISLGGALHIDDAGC